MDVHASLAVGATWSYDNVGSVIQMADNLTTPPRSYAYDPLDRLTTASDPYGTYSWTYDGNGNRLTQQANNVATMYTYQANRLATVAGATTRSYSYDAAGNPTGDGTQSYVYDGNGRLVKLFNSGTLSAEYVYDGKGRRVIKKRYTYTIVKKKPVTTITTTVYHYDFSGKLIGETDGAGAFQKDYVYLENQPLAMVTKMWPGESASWYSNDQVGLPRLMTDASGGVAWHIDFDPFGNRESLGPEFVENNLRFPGQYYDSESGLHYNYFRDYDPKTGRYIEPDPIGLKGDLNLYGYTAGNPMRFTDPLGLWRNPWTIFDESLQDAQSIFSRHDLWNGPGDAYRHCLASCMMAQENSNAEAEFFGWANEKRGDWFHNQEIGEREMDDFNNAFGRQCAKASKSKTDCQQKCLKAANSGRLKTYMPGTTPGYWY
jgi:RHS repeat-associated protein